MGLWSRWKFNVQNAIMTISAARTSPRARRPALTCPCGCSRMPLQSEGSARCVKIAPHAPHHYGTICTCWHRVVFSDQNNSACAGQVYNNGGVPINCTKTHGKIASLDDQAINATVVWRGIRITCFRQCIPGAVLLCARPDADGTLSVRRCGD